MNFLKKLFGMKNKSQTDENNSELNKSKRTKDKPIEPTKKDDQVVLKTENILNAKSVKNLIKVETKSIKRTVDKTKTSKKKNIEYLYEGKPISIGDFSKKLTVINREKGFDEFKETLNSFWDSNKSVFLYKDVSKLIRDSIKHFKKQKYTSEKIGALIDDHLASLFNKPDEIYKIAKFMIKYNVERAIELLSSIKRSNAEDAIFLEAMYLKSDLLLQNEKYDDAFSATRGDCSELIPLLKAHDRVQWTQKFSGLRAKICLKQGPPNYDDYIYNFLKEYILSMLRTISQFQHLQTFETCKRKSYENGEPLKGHIEFNNALDEIGIRNKEVFINVIFEFVYITLPTLYGIPEKYNTSVKISLLFDNLKTNRSEYKDEFSAFCKLSNELTKFENVESVLFEINSFINNIMVDHTQKSKQAVLWGQ